MNSASRLMQEQDKQRSQDRENYSFPTFTRLKVKKIKQIDLIASTATISVTILVGIYYGDHQQLFERVFGDQSTKKIILAINDQQYKRLEDSDEVVVHHKKREKMMTFTIRTTSQCDVKLDNFFSPYQLLQILLKVNIKQIDITQDERKEYVQFQCWSPDESLQTKTPPRITINEYLSYGRFKLSKCKVYAQSGLSSAISATEPTNNPQETTFVIALQKEMLLPFIQFILPICILIFLNIVLQYNGTEFAAQLASIITLIFPEMTLCTIISKDSAKQANFKFIEILSYLPLLSSFFCIISLLSGASKYKDNVYAPFFIVNSVIGIISLILIIVILILSIKKKYFHQIAKKNYVRVNYESGQRQKGIKLEAWKKNG